MPSIYLIGLVRTRNGQKRLHLLLEQTTETSVLQRTGMASLHAFQPHTKPFTAGNSRRRGKSVIVRAAEHFTITKPTLIDAPVSNHGARVRHVIYRKGLEGELDIVSPMALGGFGAPQFLAANPENKMPILLLPNGTSIYESEVIVQYILDRWHASGPSMQAASPELRAVASLAARIHDQYITPIQACMYRKMEPAERANLLQQLVKQLDVLEGICVGPYFAGDEITAGDSALFPTFVFATYILPRYFGWRDVFAGRPNLAGWWANIQQDQHAQRVIAEVTGGLEKWSKNNRWQELGISQQLAEHTEFKWVYP